MQLPYRHQAAPIDPAPGLTHGRAGLTRLTATVTAVTTGSPLRATVQASDDTWLISSACRAYMQRHGIAESQLADRLGTTIEKLRWLLMRTRPKPAAPNFAIDVQRLAQTFCCDADVLADVLRA